MRLTPWEPDVRTVMARLAERELDLQPDFQRGLAWNQGKQAKLVDTILRGWSIPPLHFLLQADDTMAVLDGQQRLTSIAAFMANDFPVAQFEPYDDKVTGLSGQYFRHFDQSAYRRFLNYRLPSYILDDYTPSEPHELFFRLNQPTGLTQAEKRNALMGTSRSQTKDLVTHAVEVHHWDRSLIGFANARLAYDDIIARFCVYLQEGTLRLSTNASRLEQQYRQVDGFVDTVTDRARQVIGHLSDALHIVRLRTGAGVRLNKATLLSWLLVGARDLGYGQVLDLSSLINLIEGGRRSSLTVDYAGFNTLSNIIDLYLNLYNDRASLRVADILSVVARDACIWRLAMETQLMVPHYDSADLRQLRRTLKVAEGGPRPDVDVLTALEDPDVWGARL